MALSLLKRKKAAPELPPRGRADSVLDRLIDRERVIDRFDADYLDDLPEILRELHDLTDENVAEHPRGRDVEELWGLCGKPDGELTITGLASALADGGVVDRRRWAPRQNTTDEQRRFKYNRVRNWKEARGVRLGRDDRLDPDAVETVNRLQSGYSHDVQGGRFEVAFDALQRPETGDPWSPLIRRLVAEDVISPDEQHLTLGPRWVGEIHYFRRELGLPQAIGLDLFTHDDALVKVGDMHDMPFEDGAFGLVYQRNTFDKSYDIRTALGECLRVLRDGGVLISDDCYDYTHGVSEMARTNIKHNDQVTRVLQPNVARVLFDRETASREDWTAHVGQLAVQVCKR